MVRAGPTEIKLKRTDTTLDLSQKAKRAEKKKKRVGRGASENIYCAAAAALRILGVMTFVARAAA